MKKETLAERISQYRRTTGMSQEELSFITGVAWATLNRWEKGHTKPRGLQKKSIERILAKEEKKK